MGERTDTKRMIESKLTPLKTPLKKPQLSSSTPASSTKRKNELEEDLTAIYLIKSVINDEDGDSDLFSQYGYAQSDSLVEATKAALITKTHKCTVVEDAQSALQFLLTLPISTSSVYCTGSTTLKEIGFISYLKQHKDACKRNIKAEVVEAKSRGDSKSAIALTREGMCADYVFSSVPALSAQGDIIVCCTSGSRTGCFNYAAKNLILVVGSNKIVESYEDCLTRMNSYVIPLENARLEVQAQRKKGAVPVTTAVPNFFASIRSGNPFGRKGRIHIVLVKQSLGF